MQADVPFTDMCMSHSLVDDLEDLTHSSELQDMAPFGTSDSISRTHPELQDVARFGTVERARGQFGQRGTRSSCWALSLGRS
jgi:hypothetical protein